MTPPLWLILAVVVSFLAYTLAVFLLPPDNDDRRIDRLSDDEFWNRVDNDGEFH